MPADDYVQTYLRIWCWVNDTFQATRVRNYLQSGKGTQAKRATDAYADLMKGLAKLAGGGNAVSTVFSVQGDQYVTTSLWRVYHGKGAPNEIQDAIWLASVCGLVDEGTLAMYADNNLGIDCGGFVANYWGMSRPDPANPNPTGATGYKPRTIWGLYPGLRRKTAAEIRADDAAVFFQDVKNDDPNIAAQQNADGSYDTKSGSQAFHIGLVSSVSVVAGTAQVDLEIAESSGAAASSGGDGVNVRDLGRHTATVSKGLVWVPDGTNRIYFIGRQGAASPYGQYLYGA